ncbi:hypothetical protein BpHYR1_022386, partial [Brachionus plicatilis]
RSKPTSYATRNIDNTKILAFMINSDMYMLNLIVQCTNSTRIPFNFTKPKICRVFCSVNLTPPVLRVSVGVVKFISIRSFQFRKI